MADKEIIGELVYNITGDDSGLDSTLKNIDKTSKKSAKSGKEVGESISSSLKNALRGGEGLLTNLQNIGGAFLAWQGLKKIKDIALALIDSRSEAQETQNKYTAVFGALGADAEKAAAQVQKSYNVSNRAAKEALSGVGDILTGRGLETKAALDMSVAVTGLAAELVSFKNYAGGAEGATEALTKGLLNQHDALIGLGIVINEQDIEKYALSLGKTKKELNATELAQANFHYILEQSKNAVGDTANSVNSYAFQARRAKAAQEDFSSVLGTPIAAIATTSLKVYSATLEHLTLVTKAYTVQSHEELLATLNASERKIKAANIEAKLAAIAKNTTIQGLAETVAKQARYNKELEKLRALDLAEAQAAATKKNDITDEQKKFQEAYAAKVKEYSQSVFDQQIALAFAENSLHQAKLDKNKSAIEKYTAEVLQIKADQGDKEAGLELLVNEKLKSLAAEKLSKKAEINALEIQIATDHNNKLFEDEAAHLNQLRDLQNQAAQEKFQNFSEHLSNVTQLFTTSLNAVTTIADALSARSISAINRQREADLKASGVASKTKIQDLKDQYAAAVEKGDLELANALRLKIKEQEINTLYDKKIEKEKRKAVHLDWQLKGLQIAATSPLAIVQSIAQLGPIAGPIVGGIAVGSQVAAWALSEPPAAAGGGLIPGSDFSGDNRIIRANSSEMVLTQSDQTNLLNQIRGDGGGQNIELTVVLEGDILYKNIHKAKLDGRLPL